MSRGLGATQNLVLTVLAEKGDREPEWRWTRVFEIAHRRFCNGELEWDGNEFGGVWKCDTCGAPPAPTAAETESIRRAIRTLDRDGYVEADRFAEPTGRKVAGTEWTYKSPINGELVQVATRSVRKQLFARLTLTPDEREAEAERKRAWLARLAERFGR